MFDISSRSRRAGVGLLAAAFGIVALGGCGSEESGPLVTEDNAEFVVAIGDEFTIVLEANVTTGFSWQLETPLDESILTHVDDDYIAPGTDAVGSPGKQELTFRATEARESTCGTSVLSIAHRTRLRKTASQS